MMSCIHMDLENKANFFQKINVFIVWNVVSFGCLTHANQL